MTPEQILSEADRCVKCGLCLPHCPTYGYSLNEAESPRGRIALMQAVSAQQLPPSSQLYSHLDHCLGCRACEKACPSGVRYGWLIDATRTQQAKDPAMKTPRLRSFILGLASNPKAVKRGAMLLRLLPRSVLAPLFRLFGQERLFTLLPQRLSAKGWHQRYPATEKTKGRVGLFTGCISQVTDRAALEATIRLLNRLGKEAIVPRTQGCCGALHLHAGEPETAHRLIRQNQDAFGEQSLEAIVSIASGCGAQLSEHGQLGVPILDISTYLNGLSWPEQNSLRPLPKRAAIHDPCSLRNTLGTAEAPYQLLKHIPELEVVALPGNAICCGAGGINLLTQPDMADGLRAGKLDALKACQAEILLTSNTSCALHLAAGIRAAGLDIEVLHPIELLERQIE